MVIKVKWLLQSRRNLYAAKMFLPLLEKLLRNVFAFVGNSKRITFQQEQTSKIKPHDAIPEVENDEQPIIFEPEDGQQRDAHEGARQQDDGTEQQDVGVE